MVLSDELPVPKAAGGATRRALFVAAIGVTALIATIVALTGNPGAQVVRVWAAAIGFAFAFRGWHDAVGRRRRVRGWISLALGIWLISETARLLGAWTGQPAILAEADTPTCST